MPWTAANVPDLDGRVAVVTGANGGLGLETARALAGAGAHVVMACRDRDKAERAETSIHFDHPGATSSVVGLDLADLASIERAADEILAAHPVIDVLVNNAGLMAMPPASTADGFEMQLGVNHLGHWALTARLLPAVLAATAARVVTVTSVARHVGGAVDPADPHLRGRYRPWRAYAQAKLANYHFGLGLQRQFAACGASTQSLVAHPGLSNTDLQARTMAEGGGGRLVPVSHSLTASVGMSPPVGARPQLRAATDPGARGGQFYVPRFVFTGAAVRRPVLALSLERRIRELWEISERETGLPIDIAALVS